jgi:hypothetical protein
LRTNTRHNDKADEMRVTRRVRAGANAAAGSNATAAANHAVRQQGSSGPSQRSPNTTSAQDAAAGRLSVPRVNAQRRRIEAAFGGALRRETRFVPNPAVGPGTRAHPPSTIQRLVASASEGPEDDRVFQNTTLTAHTLVGGKIKKMSAVDFSQDFASTTEALAITAHGKINVVGNYSGEQIADKLTDKTTGLQEGTHEIHFQSCYAAVEGAANPISTPTSVIGTVKAALTKRGKDAGWTRVPLVSGSYGPQIVVRIPKDIGPGFDIMKAVVNPKWVKYASAIQGVLAKVITDVKQKIVLNFGGEGTDFFKQAERDEAQVRQLKEVFIHLVSGQPGKIDGKLLSQLQAEWKNQGHPEQAGKLIFETGVDLRAPKETVTV